MFSKPDLLSTPLSPDSCELTGLKRLSTLSGLLHIREHSLIDDPLWIALAGFFVSMGCLLVAPLWNPEKLSP